MTEDPLALLPTDSRQPFTSARWLSVDPDQPVLEVSTKAPGLLVIADTWMPGWSATVNGRSAPILLGNLAQRVIPILIAGNHRVALAYYPPGLALGCSVSVLAGVAWGLFSVVILLRQRKGAFESAPALRPSSAAPTRRSQVNTN